MAEQTKKKVPEIRFKGFAEEWEEKTLGDIAEIKTGPFGSTLHAEDYVDNGEPIITTEHFKTGELPNNKNGIPQVCEQDYARLKGYMLQVGDIVFSRVGSVDINAHAKKQHEGWLFSGRVLRVRSAATVDSEYLHHELATFRVRKSVILRSVGQTMPSINTEILKDTQIQIPNQIKEQEQIGAYIQKIDQIIGLHQRKHEKLVTLKKAMLQKMFPQNGTTTPEIRFKGFSEPWEEKKLGEIGETQSGIGFPGIEQGGNSGIPFFKVSDMNNAGNENEMIIANNYVSKEQIERKNWKPISRIPGVVFAKVGAAIMLNRKRLVRSPFLIDNNMMAYLFDNSWEMNFGKTLFETINLTSYAQIGALPSYNGSDIEAIAVILPCIQEQQKIGTYFRQMDELIAHHGTQLEKLKQIKAACLEKMFV